VAAGPESGLLGRVEASIAVRARNISYNVTDATHDVAVSLTRLQRSLSILVGFAASWRLALLMHSTLLKEEPSC